MYNPHGMRPLLFDFFFNLGLEWIYNGAIKIFSVSMSIMKMNISVSQQ